MIVLMLFYDMIILVTGFIQGLVHEVVGSLLGLWVIMKSPNYLLTL